MYAIVKTGGKQYRVEEGQTLLVERLPASEGDTVALQPVLYRSEDAVFDRDGLSKVKVSAKVVDHVRGPKLRVFKFKPKRGYRRTTGHRQELTRLEVTEIKLGAAGAARRTRGAAKGREAEAEARPATAEAKPTTGEAKPKAEAKPAARKPRSPKAKPAGDEPKKPAARRPAARKPPPTKPDQEDKSDGS